MVFSFDPVHLCCWTITYHLLIFIFRNSNNAVLGAYAFDGILSFNFLFWISLSFELCNYFLYSKRLPCRTLNNSNYHLNTLWIFQSIWVIRLGSIITLRPLFFRLFHWQDVSLGLDKHFGVLKLSFLNKV